MTMLVQQINQGLSALDKAKPSYSPFEGTSRDGWMDERENVQQTDTDIQMDRHRAGWTDRWTDRQTDGCRQADEWMNNEWACSGVIQVYLPWD